MSTTPPKGHHGFPGIVPCFIEAQEVYDLHRFAQAHDMIDQQAAAYLLTQIIRLWADGQIVIDPT